MAVVINGSGTVTGISVGGLPDGIVDAGTLATNSVDSAELIDGSIDNSHLADNAADTAEIADNAITLAKMAGGTDGNIISFDANGDPVAIATGSDGQVLTSAGAGAQPAFEDAAGGGADISVDSWHLYIRYTIDVSTTSDINFQNSVHTGSNISVSSGVVTVGTAGMYLISYSAVFSGAPSRNFDLNIYVNDVLIEGTYIHATSTGYNGWSVVIPVQLAASDVIKIRGSGTFYGNTQGQSRFVGARIGD